jgi:hypothetical protein
VAVLRTEQLTASSPVTAAFGATTRAAVGIIVELNRRLTDLEAELATHFEAHRTPTSTVPHGETHLQIPMGISHTPSTH